MYSENLSQSSNADNNKDSQNLIFSNKRNHISEVWNYFEKIEWGKDKKIAKCIIAKCTHNAFSCGNEGTTRPLWRHLENSHWMVYVKTEEYYKKKKKTQIESGNIEEFLKKVNYFLNYFLFSFFNFDTNCILVICVSSQLLHYY